MNFRLLGWFSLSLAVIAILPYLVRVINQKTFKLRSKGYFKVHKVLREAHRVAGILLALIGLWHGYLALSGNIRLHTGVLAYLSFFATAALGITLYRKRGKTLQKVHRSFAALSYLLLALHLLKPWALGQWFGLW